MKQLLSTIRLRLGEFWWYSLMLFCACRLADLLNMFVGLYLVPKYIAPGELGAVLPLSTFATALAMPASVFAMTFTKEVNTLATRREFGKLKSLMKGVFTATAVFLAAAIVLSRLVLPHFLGKIRIVEGSLGILIIAVSFVGCTSQIYTNALQALKKFREISLMNVVCAPIRLLAMLVAMPFRALSGYFVGQGATPAVNILASLWFLRKELAVKAEPYWNRAIAKRFSLLFAGMAGYQCAGVLLGLAEHTCLRERLPDLESAAYYMATRFSDMSVLISGTLLTVLFPFTAEAAESGRSTRPIVVKTSAVAAIGGLALAAAFAAFGRPLMALLPGGGEYARYAWAVPWLIVLNILTTVQCIVTNTEVSAARFGFLKWWIPLNLVLPAALYLLPIGDLRDMMYWLTFAAVAKAAFALYEIRRSK